jgi:hypothetical protein
MKVTIIKEGNNHCGSKVTFINEKFYSLSEWGFIPKKCLKKIKSKKWRVKNEEFFNKLIYS